MFKIHNIVLFHNDRFAFYYTQSLPYPGNFWSQYTGLGAQKIKQYSTQKFLYQTDKLISFKFIESRTSYTLTFESNMVWPKKTMKISHKKEKKQQPKLPCTIVTSYPTCDR